MRSIGVVTVARSDYGIYLPLLKRLQKDRSLKLRLFVGGMHLERQFGMTVREIEADGFDIAARVKFDMRSDSPAGIGRAMGSGTTGFARAFSRWRPDILVVLGDRFEMHSAALAALPAKIPVAHIHGGELTQGAIDDSLRHSMTKLSHLHFVSTPEYARRVIQMGEQSWRVKIVGALGLDNLMDQKALSAAALERRFGLKLRPAPLLVTFHPVTLEYEKSRRQMEQLLKALAHVGLPVVFTSPNADTGHRRISRMIQEYRKTHANAFLVENFGSQAYFGMMSVAAAMVGNSSSGIIEGPSMGLPVVNIGSRQAGRIKAANVIDTTYDCASIERGIRLACTPAWREKLNGMHNPYDRGGAATQIIRVLQNCSLGDRLLTKRFNDTSCQVDLKGASITRSRRQVSRQHRGK